MQSRDHWSRTRRRGHWPRLYNMVLLAVAICGTHVKPRPVAANARQRGQWPRLYKMVLLGVAICGTHLKPRPLVAYARRRDQWSRLYKVGCAISMEIRRRRSYPSPRGLLTGVVLSVSQSVSAMDVLAPSSQPKAGWGLILLLGSISAMGPLAIDMYLPTMPAIARNLHADMSQVQRTLSSYFVGLAIGQLIYGTLSDRLGRKKPMLFGLAVFALASVGCAMATSVRALMFLRFAQALGGCAEMVISRAIVRDRFDGREATRVFASLMLVMGAAPIVAPLMGGFFVSHGGWRMSFWLLAAIACVCFLSVCFNLRESLPPSRRLVHGPSEIARVFTHLLRHQHFMAHTLSGSLLLTGLFAYVGSSSFVFIELFHVSPQWFWTIFGANAAGLITSSQINGRLSQRIAPHVILRRALIATVISGAVLMFSSAWAFPSQLQWLHYGLFFPSLFVYMCTAGFIFPSATALAMGPQGRIAGNASALIGFLQFLISGCGTWLVSALYDGSAKPMAIVMLSAAIVALLINLLMARHRHESAMAALSAAHM
jgi:DHA1 family bicyclomycin/chloramphenicol resistance-like MFS transporter